jgi:uroporphyrinogen decarboxylase
MNSKELVKRTIQFKSPERLPFTGSMAESDFSGDTVAVFPDMGTEWWLGGGGYDEWGCFWEVDPEHNDMGQVKNIILDKLDEFMSLKIPDSLNPQRYSHWPEILERAERAGKYVVCCNGSFLFERAHFLHGFENTLMDIMIEPDIMKSFLRHIAKYHLDTIKYINDNFRGKVHGYRGTDDWGSQNACLISPKIFTDVFSPVYKDIFQKIHDAEMDAWMHSCGQVLDIIPLLIDVGLDVVHLMQPNVFPIPKLADLKGKICFEMCADAQNTLLTNNEEALSSEIKELLDTCCSDKGGYIEVTLDKMYFDADGVDPKFGEFCHSEYRRLDPFIK